ncbi:MAG: hypothetical protein L6R41_006412, partial [Letrouitia leprolyta]
MVGRKKSKDHKRDCESALETIKLASRWCNDAKAFVVQEVKRLRMFFRLMTAITQSTIYWMSIASEVALTISATPSRNELEPRSKKKRRDDKKIVIGNSVIGQFALILTGRELQDYERHYAETLEVTKVALGVVRQTVRSRHGGATDHSQSSANNVLDPRLHLILIQVLKYLTICLDQIGVWIGDRLPTGFIMVIRGPIRTTQHVAGLDSGAAENVISHRSALASDLSIEPYEGPLLEAIGTSVRPAGRVTFNWCVSNFDTVWYTTTFAVLEDDHCKGFNILLGKEEIDK